MGQSNAPLHSANFGDAKFGFQVSDHNGWIKLDGRLTSSLSASQQIQAAALGIGANLPNMSDRIPLGASATRPLLSSGGAMSRILSQNQLPNVGLSISGSFSGSSGTYNFRGTATGGSVPSFATQSANQVQASIPVSGSISGSTASMNGGVAQQAIDTTPAFIGFSFFIYLGA